MEVGKKNLAHVMSLRVFNRTVWRREIKTSQERREGCAQTYEVSPERSGGHQFCTFFSSQIIINMARKICDFNHISPELNREQIDELIGYYKTTHQKWFLYKKAHRHYKLIKYAARLTSGAIAGGGIASVIVSGSVLTIISLGASLLIEILLDYKNVNENMNNCKYAYQSYQHLMIQIKTTSRLGLYNSENLVNSIANLDNFFVDVCPLVDKYKKDYYIKYIDSSPECLSRHLSDS